MNCKNQNSIVNKYCFFYIYFLKKKNIKKKNFFFNFFFHYFFLKYLEKKLFTKINIIVNNLAKLKTKYLKKKKVIKFLKKKCKGLGNFFFFFKKVVLLFLSVFLYCDATLFVNWLVQFLETNEIKKHKIALKFVAFFLSFLFLRFEFNLKIKGFYLRIKGKIGLGGASKKKKFTLKKKKFTLINFINKINYSKSDVRTKSGTLGIVFFLVF